MEELKDILVNAGAIAGVAAIVGVAVLAMLYFSQARDVRRLREWAGREPERAAEVELRAAQIASQAIAQAYESMALRQSEADAAAQIAAEQGVDVTDVVIAAEPPPQTGEHHEPIVTGMEGAADDPEHLEQIAAAAGEPEEVSAEFEAASGTGEHPEPIVTGMEGAADDPEHLEQISVEAAEAAEVAANGQTAEPLVQAAAGAAGTQEHVSVPPPVMTAGEVGETRPSRLAPSTPAATRGQVPLPPLPPLDTSEFLAVNRTLPTVSPDYYAAAEAGGAARFESDRRAPERNSRTPMIVAGALVALFAVVLLFTQLTGDEPESIRTPAAKSSDEKQTKITSERNAQVNRPAVTVSVLNGTQTSGLAKLVGDQLIAAGFTETTTGNRGDGINHTASIVYFQEGSKLEAQEVARELRIKQVREIDDETSAAGGSAPVVVVLGADIEQ